MVIDNGKFTTVKIFVETFYSKNYTESIFQFGHIVSRNHVKRRKNILLNAIVGFLTSHGFVWGVLLILQNLHLFLILPVSLHQQFLDRMEADVSKFSTFH